MTIKLGSYQELTWLLRLKQIELFAAEMGLELPGSPPPTCEASDCFPWTHTVFECVEWRLKQLGAQSFTCRTPNT